ncbi:peptidylprolyl isomerase [uncultured Pseudoteredinibacter sp.]|uniref:peptidylprolyl isomerase n=1 Tax=uncultured Pseudoteredinibacter sp. TaxID=1641701 RepID=UPI002628EF0E|nr:peptidylprolyl isomerase [uncultured Pseudoteredinibacter sp.]
MKNNKYSKLNTTAKLICSITAATLCLGAASAIADKSTDKQASKPRSPSEISAQAKNSSWRDIDNENLLRMQLDTGTVWIELAPQFAPNHVSNTKALVREGFYDGLSIYRFVEGFVAQGGDASEEKAIKNAKRAIKSERYTSNKVDFTPLGFKDSFAEDTGFVAGFAAAKNSKGESWMVHCPGAFAMARNNPVDSGGTEFYVVLGHAPRYLDRNVTVFGRVISGMGALLSLQREKPKDESKEYNPIRSVKVAADLSKAEQKNWQVMKTDSADFKELILSRANRPEEWFVEQPGVVDVCGVTVPSRESGS